VTLAASLLVLNLPNNSCADASEAPLAAVLQPGELGPNEVAPTTRSRYRVFGCQMAAGVSPRLVSALRHTFSTYYHCLLQLHTEARFPGTRVSGSDQQQLSVDV